MGLLQLFFQLSYVHGLQKDRDDAKTKLLEVQQKKIEAKDYHIQALRKDSIDLRRDSASNKQIDEQIKLKQLEILNTQVASNKELEQRQENLQKTLQANLEGIRINHKSDLDRENALLKLQTYIPFITDLTSIVNNPKNGLTRKTQEHLLNELYPKVILMNDSAVMSQLHRTLRDIDYYILVSETRQQIDSLMGSTDVLIKNIVIPPRSLSTVIVHDENIKPSPTFISVRDSVKIFESASTIQKIVPRLRSNISELVDIEWPTLYFYGIIDSLSINSYVVASKIHLFNQPQSLEALRQKLGNAFDKESLVIYETFLDEEKMKTFYYDLSAYGIRAGAMLRRQKDDLTAKILRLEDAMIQSNSILTVQKK